MTESQAGAHATVLLREAVEALAVAPDGRYLDGTFGRGGHSGEILARLGSRGSLLAIDRDPEAVAQARERYGKDARFRIEAGCFSEMAGLAQECWPDGAGLNGVLLDLGVSSPQLDDAVRGFSFQQDGPLDMRMDPQAGLSAAEWLREAPEQEIARVIYEFGEERYSRRIAREVCRVRRDAPISRTTELAELVCKAVPKREPGKHPATRTFQAIRIHINGELDELQKALDAATGLLVPGGRLVVISFHSLEDRMVKRFMRVQERGPVVPRHLPLPPDQPAPQLRRIGKQQRPGEEEVTCNPRARSAVMRVAEKVAA